jgi:hypothetical protein
MNKEQSITKNDLSDIRILSTNKSTWGNDWDGCILIGSVVVGGKIYDILLNSEKDIDDLDSRNQICIIFQYGGHPKDQFDITFKPRSSKEKIILNLFLKTLYHNFYETQS